MDWIGHLSNGQFLLLMVTVVILAMMIAAVIAGITGIYRDIRIAKYKYASQAGAQEDADKEDPDADAAR